MRPRGEVLVGLLGGQLVDRAAGPDLAVELAPVDDQRGARARLELGALDALVVGEEAEALGAEPLQQDHAGVRGAVGVGRGEGHRVGQRAPRASASSHHSPSCSIGSSASASRSSGGRSSRRGLMRTSSRTRTLGLRASSGPSSTVSSWPSSSGARRPHRPSAPPRCRCAAAKRSAHFGTHQLPRRRAPAAPGASSSTDIAARATPTESPTPNCFTVGSPLRMKLREDGDHDQGRRADHPARRRRGRPRSPRGRSCAVARRLLDLAHQEHLVVHREAEEDGEHDQRHEARDRVAVAARCRSRPGSSPQPNWKQAVTTPNAAQTESTIAIAACAETTNERKAISSTRKPSAITAKITRKSLSRDPGGEVDVARGLAADVGLEVRARGRLRDHVLADRLDQLGGLLVRGVGRRDHREDRRRRRTC